MKRERILEIAAASGLKVDLIEGESLTGILSYAAPDDAVRFARAIIQETITAMDRRVDRGVLEEHGVWLARPGGGGFFVRRNPGGSSFGTSGVPAVRVTFEKTGGGNGRVK